MREQFSFHVINRRLPQAIQIYLCALLATAITMKLCYIGIPTKTINIHDLNVCKQQQTASGSKLTFMSKPHLHIAEPG